jgi:hypothetical protein
VGEEWSVIVNRLDRLGAETRVSLNEKEAGARKKGSGKQKSRVGDLG